MNSKKHIFCDGQNLVKHGNWTSQYFGSMTFPNETSINWGISHGQKPSCWSWNRHFSWCKIAQGDALRPCQPSNGQASGGVFVVQGRERGFANATKSVNIAGFTTQTWRNCNDLMHQLYFWSSFNHWKGGFSFNHWKTIGIWQWTHVGFDQQRCRLNQSKDQD